MSTLSILILTILGTVAFAVAAPVVGCLLAGLDRVVSARMQGRVGPPILQPYYDVRKLLSKDRVSVNSSEGAYIALALGFTLLAGGVFFTGGTLLLCVFLVTLSSLMFIVAAYSSRSPYAEVGAARETLQVLSYEPMVLLMCVVFILASGGSLYVQGLFVLDEPIIVHGWLAFLGLLFVLTIKLRKSPFDISMSHHAHQEIVRGVTTEMSGPTLAKVEIMHWCENVLFLGWVGMFFVWSNPLSILLAIAVVIAVYFLEIWIDNNFARVKWRAMLDSAWVVALVCGGANIVFLLYL